jgi:hypothetical protein
MPFGQEPETVQIRGHDSRTHHCVRYRDFFAHYRQLNGTRSSPTHGPGRGRMSSVDRPNLLAQWPIQSVVAAILTVKASRGHEAARGRVMATLRL